MKKLMALIALILTLSITSTTFAADINIIIDDQKKVYTPGPIIDNGSTLVPMRAFFETMGATVSWEDRTRTVTAKRDGTEVKLTIGSLLSYVNNNKVYLTVRPQIIQEKTFVPLRFISEALGAEVLWDGVSRTISIKDKTKQKIEPVSLVDSQKYEVKTTYTFVNYGDEADVDFNVSMGATSSSPYQNDDSLSITPTPNDITSDDYGNKYATIKVEKLKSGQRFDIAVTKLLTNSGIKYTIDTNNISKDYSNLSNYSTLVSPQDRIESNNPQIISKALQISGNETNPYNIAKKVYEYVNMHITYDKNPAYAWKGALSGLITGRGVCEEYSKLFTAMMRVNKIPTRSVNGFWLQDNVKSGIGYDWTDITAYPHEWPEFYLSGYGWIIAEPTISYTVNNIKTVPWEQFANQATNGHILLGYEPDKKTSVTWEMSGYGELAVKNDGRRTEIRKVK